MVKNNQSIPQNKNKKMKLISRKSQDKQTKNNSISTFNDGIDKFNRILRKTLIYTLYNQVQIWQGKVMNFNHRPILADLYLMATVRNKNIINIIYIKGSPESLRQFRDQKNPDCQFNQKLQKIIIYFKQNPARLQQQRKIMRKILRNFSFTFPYAYWYNLFHSYNIYNQDFDSSYFKKIDKWFEKLNLKEKKFSSYISSLPCLNMQILCKPFMDKMKGEVANRLKMISAEKMKQYAQIWEQQRELKIKNKCKKRSQFMIDKLYLQNFEFSKKLELMEQFIVHINCLLSEEEIPEQIPKRHVTLGLTIQHVRMEIPTSSEPLSDNEELSESRSRLSIDENRELSVEQSVMQIQQNKLQKQNQTDPITIKNNNQQDINLQLSIQSQPIFPQMPKMLSQDKLVEVFDQLNSLNMFHKQSNLQKNKYYLISQNLMQEEDLEILHKQPQDIFRSFWDDKKQQTIDYFLLNMLKK